MNEGRKKNPDFQVNEKEPSSFASFVLARGARVVNKEDHIFHCKLLKCLHANRFLFRVMKPRILDYLKYCTIPNYRNMNMDYFGLFQVSFLKKNLFTPNWTLYHDLVQQYNCRWNRSRIGNRSRRDNLYPTKRTHPTWSCV